MCFSDFQIQKKCFTGCSLCRAVILNDRFLGNGTKWVWQQEIGMFWEFDFLAYCKVSVNGNELAHFSIRLHIALLNLLLFTGLSGDEWKSAQPSSRWPRLCTRLGNCILKTFRLLAAILILFRSRENPHSKSPGDTPAPGKMLFLDLKAGKRHIGPKNNS